jgi:uncharacterized membrane protein YhhN
VTPSGLDRAYAGLALSDVALAAHGGVRTSRLRWVTKSALMPLLIGKLANSGDSGDPTWSGLRTRTQAGLALSWAGDVALLGESDAAFATGLGCFAGAHSCYGNAFASARQSTRPAAAVPVGIGGALLGAALSRRAGRLGVPVAGYSALITSMAMTALGVDPNRIGQPATRRIAAGAGLFVVSDGLIGLRKFALPAGTGRGLRSVIDAAVMATYAGGQWLIADGVSRAATPEQPAGGSR